MRVLDLFCGAGGAAMGLHKVWPDAEIVGVDIQAQPRYPFKFSKADAMTYPLEGFDFIWASPPCQAHTLCQRIRKNEHPDLIPATRKRLKAAGVDYVIENVVGAPLINPIELCGAMFKGLRVYRHRLFECSFHVEVPEHPAHDAPLRKMGRMPQEGEFMHVVGNFVGVKIARQAMGIEWMTRDELREAIPPAFSEYIARFAPMLDRPATPDEMAEMLRGMERSGDMAGWRDTVRQAATMIERLASERDRAMADVQSMVEDAAGADL